jgi:hypothetical protein
LPRGFLIAFSASAIYFFMYLQIRLAAALQLQFNRPLSIPLFLDILKVGAMSSISSFLTVATILCADTRSFQVLVLKLWRAMASDRVWNFCWCP